MRKGDALDCACGYGNGSYGADATSLAVVVKSPGGKLYDAATGGTGSLPARVATLADRPFVAPESRWRIRPLAGPSLRSG